MRSKEDAIKYTIKVNTDNTAHLFDQFHQMVKFSLTNLMVVASSPVAITYTSDIAPVLSNEFLDIQTNIECGFTLKSVRDMTIRYGQMNLTDKYAQPSSII